MNKKQLWDSILQQAISGKLVPQLDTEPAVEQIGPEPDSDEVPFALPETWKLVNLKALSTHIQYGYTASASDLGEAKLLRITDIQNGKVNWDSVPFCSISASDISKFSVIPDDIVIARSGGTVGKSFKVRQVKQHAVFASYLIRVRLNNKLPVNASYINFYLDSPLYWLSISQSAQGTAIKNVNAQQLSALLIPLPPLEEQRRIVAKLEELKPLVDQFGGAYEKLSELEADFPRKLKASILQAALQGKLVPQQDTEPAVEQLGPAPSPDEVPFALPEKWKWVQFDKVLELISGRDLAITQILDKPNQSSVPYITGASQIIDGCLVLNRWTAEPVVISHKKDVLLSCKGTVGKLAINIYGDIHIARQIMAIRCKERVSQCRHVFVKLFFEFVIDKLLAHARGLIPGISRKDVLSLWIPLPPLEEQRRIVERVEQLFAEIDKMSACKSP